MTYTEYVKIVSFFLNSPEDDDCIQSNLQNRTSESFASMVRQVSISNFPLLVGADDRVALIASPDVYCKDDIASACADFTELVLFLFLTLDSTNTYLKELPHRAEGVSVCIAEQQTQGRGRRGKDWLSPFAANLYMSIRTKVTISPRVAGGASLIVGLAIIKALEGCGFQGLKIKWPNDIYFDNKKLAGILIEVVSVTRTSIDLVVGVGLNVKMPVDDAKQIDQPWVDLFNLLASNSSITELPSRNKLAIALIREIIANLRLFERQGLKYFFNEWSKYDLLRDKKVQVKRENDFIYGVVVGINVQGELLVKGESDVMAINAGEVSVRLS